MAIVVVRGTGDVGSAIAHRLFVAGNTVVLHDQGRPAHARRGVSFVDALFEGRATLQGVHAKLVRGAESLQRMVACRRGLPVVDGEIEAVLRAVRPHVLVDARMRKREHPAPQRGLAPLTIGVGPNFVAGETTDVVVETAYGATLGQVIHRGTAQALAGEPKLLAGHGRERFVYSPVPGTFRTPCAIGATVTARERVAMVGQTPLHAPLTGVLRGLTHDGADVEVGTKVIEIDASGDDSSAYRFAERPVLIAAAVLDVVQQLPTGYEGPPAA